MLSLKKPLVNYFLVSLLALCACADKEEQLTPGVTLKLDGGTRHFRLYPEVKFSTTDLGSIQTLRFLDESDVTVVFELSRFGLTAEGTSAPIGPPVDPFIPAPGDPVKELSYGTNGLIYVSGIILGWEVDSEIAIDYFDLEWSVDGENFEVVESWNASGDAPDHGSYLRGIRISDVRGFVRIKTVYMNGQFSYSGKMGVNVTYPFYFTGFGGMAPEEHHAGKVTITRYDKNNRIIAGTFNAETPIGTVTDGRFYYKY